MNSNLNAPENSLLGNATVYPTQYAPDILFPIPRANARAGITNISGITQGVDWWHAFELSWLDQAKKPMVAIGRLSVPANSPNLIESKSLKLYFNSLNFHSFNTTQAFVDCVIQDLSKAVGVTVQLELFQADHLPITTLKGACIDHLQLLENISTPDATILKLASNDHEITEETLYSHLLRTNCPITNQPDWASIIVRYQGAPICPQSLLTYLVSYRQHADFHEQCIEKIYADIYKILHPKRLMVYAMYTRRGGLDINPCRVSHMDWLPTPLRLARQ